MRHIGRMEHIAFTVSPETRAAIVALAREQHVTVAELLREVIDCDLARRASERRHSQLFGFVRHAAAGR